MKWYLAREKFEYTNAVGQQMTAKAGDTVAICLLQEEKALKRAGKIRDIADGEYEVKPMTTAILNGEAPTVKKQAKKGLKKLHRRGN